MVTVNCGVNSWIYSTLPANKQMMTLSATYPESLAQHITTYMRSPVFVRLNPNDPSLLGEDLILLHIIAVPLCSVSFGVEWNIKPCTLTLGCLWHQLGIYLTTTSAERQSARMSEIKNVG